MRVPEGLSTHAEKRSRYGDDPHFRAGFITVADAVGAANVEPFLRPIATLLLKPEALVSRMGERCVAYLLAHGFVPLAAERVAISSLAVRELWRYQINVATEARLRAMERIFAMAPSMWLAFSRPDGDEPASVVLNKMKGPSELSKREAWHLRSSIGARPSRLLTYVHVAEEPADVTRDLGVLFDCERREALVSAFCEEALSEEGMRQAVRDAEACVAPHDLDPALSTERLRLGGEVGGWDAIVVEAESMTMDISGERRLLSPGDGERGR